MPSALSVSLFFFTKPSAFPSLDPPLQLGQFPPERAAELESRLSASLEQLSSLRAEKEVLAGEGEVLRKAKRAAEAEAEEARTQREDAVKVTWKFLCVSLKMFNY